MNTVTAACLLFARLTTTRRAPFEILLQQYDRHLQQALTARRQARGHQRHGDIGDDSDGSVELMARSDGDDHEVRSSFCFAATTSRLQQALTARRQARGHRRHGNIGDDCDGSVELMARGDDGDADEQEQAMARSPPT